jgi:hypothetical protein
MQGISKRVCFETQGYDSPGSEQSDGFFLTALHPGITRAVEGGCCYLQHLTPASFAVEQKLLTRGRGTLLALCSCCDNVRGCC